MRCSELLRASRHLLPASAFPPLKSHYLFAHHFCRIRRGNEKGVVEGLVKFTRLNFFVPVPQVRDFDELNAFLRQRCEEDRQRRLRGQPGTKAQLLVEDQAAFLPWPMRAARSKSVHGKKTARTFCVRAGASHG